MSFSALEARPPESPMSSRRAGLRIGTGRWGERIAAEHLEQGGWTVLERNYRFGRNEIDLIARRGEVIAFVEVKTRSGNSHGHPLEGIGSRKRASIERVAAGWIQNHGPDAATYRFDAVAVSVGSPCSPFPHVEHVEGAWGV